MSLTWFWIEAAQAVIIAAGFWLGWRYLAPRRGDATAAPPATPSKGGAPS